MPQILRLDGIAFMNERVEFNLWLALEPALGLERA